MQTIEVVDTRDGQTIRLPDEFRFATPKVSIRRQGESIVLEPAKMTSWPAGFFEAIAIDDEAFMRPDQGETPPAPTFGRCP